MRLWTLRRGEAPVTIGGQVYRVGDPIEDGDPVLAELANRVQILENAPAPAPAPAPDPAPEVVDEDEDGLVVEEDSRDDGPNFTRKVWTIGGAEG
jgi:hypothetical protein